MKYQQSPNRWSCLPTSFAMILDINVERLIKMIGHDGSDVYWPELPEPLKRRGFHPQELILIAWSLGYSVTPFEALPQSQSDPGVLPVSITMRETPDLRLKSLMYQSDGVLTGETRFRQRHAIAWSDGTYYDPNNVKCNLKDFRIECFWAIKSR